MGSKLKFYPKPKNKKMYKKVQPCTPPPHRIECPESSGRVQIPTASIFFVTPPPTGAFPCCAICSFFRHFLRLNFVNYYLKLKIAKP